MNLRTFQILASLARLEAEILTLRWGCLSSVCRPRLPLRGVPERIRQRDGSWRVESCVYLWTFTLPDKLALLSDLTERWARFIKMRKRDLPEFRMVRGFEVSPRGRWHAHGIALERIDVRRVLLHMRKYGFGRVGVKAVPVAKAAYLGKYMTKSRSTGTGARMLACVGFKGCPAEDVNFRDEYSEHVRALTPEMVQSRDRFYPWHFREGVAFERWAAALNVERPAYSMTKLEKPSWAETLKKLAESGETLLLGEWRGSKVTGRYFDDDKNPDVQVFKVSVNHSFERADGRQILLVEYLPDGTKVEDVKTTMQPGDKCIALLSPSGVQVKGMQKSVVLRFEVLSRLLS